jgi:hypothetical protein
MKFLKLYENYSLSDSELDTIRDIFESTGFPVDSVTNSIIIPLFDVVPNNINHVTSHDDSYFDKFVGEGRRESVDAIYISTKIHHYFLYSDELDDMLSTPMEWMSDNGYELLHCDIKLLNRGQVQYFRNIESFIDYLSEVDRLTDKGKKHGIIWHDLCFKIPQTS